MSPCFSLKDSHGWPILREFVHLTSSWPPARVEGGSEQQLMTPFPVDPVDPLKVKVKVPVATRCWHYGTGSLKLGSLSCHSQLTGFAVTTSPSFWMKRK